MRVYLCGPMTGLPEYNYPAFHEWEERLERAGMDVYSPARVLDWLESEYLTDDRECLTYLFENIPGGGLPPADAEGKWNWFIRRTLMQLLCCDVVGVLPNTNEQFSASRGMQLEHSLAHKIGMDCIPVEQIEAVYLDMLERDEPTSVSPSENEVAL